MQEIYINIFKVPTKLTFPNSLSDIIHFLTKKFTVLAECDTVLNIDTAISTDENLYITTSSTSNKSDSSQLSDFADRYLSFLIQEISPHLQTGILLSAAIVRVNDKVILIPGLKGAGKSLLTAWFQSNGHQFSTDRASIISEDLLTKNFFHTPLKLPNTEQDCTLALSAILNNHKVVGDDTYFTTNADNTITGTYGQPISLIICPHFAPGQGLNISPLTSAHCSLKLMSSILNSSNISRKFIAKLAGLTRDTPALHLTFGDWTQLSQLNETIFTHILDMNFKPKSLQSFFSPFQISSANDENDKTKKIVSNPPLLTATPQGQKKTLTIGMATYDDYSGVYFSVQAIKMYHPEITDQIEIIVIDNNPTGPCAHPLKKLEESTPNYRYIPFNGYSGTAIRDHIFRQANSEYVLCIDCHVLIVPGAIKKLIDYFKENNQNPDLVQGPLLNDNMSKLSTHFTPKWQQGMYGCWELDDRGTAMDGDPFEIPMQGLGLFACRKDAWVGLNPRFRGFGGEEGYLHEKFRQNGGKALCLPFLRWMHRFDRPHGVPYPIDWDDRVFNYLTGLEELGLDQKETREYFSEFLGVNVAKNIFINIDREIGSPFFLYDAIYCLVPDNKDVAKQIQEEFAETPIEKSIRIAPLPSQNMDELTENTVHDELIHKALSMGYKKILIIENDHAFFRNHVGHFEKAMEEVADRAWDITYYANTYPEQEDKQTNTLYNKLENHEKVTDIGATGYNLTSIIEVLAPHSVKQDVPINFASLLKNKLIFYPEQPPK